MKYVSKKVSLLFGQYGHLRDFNFVYLGLCNLIQVYLKIVCTGVDVLKAINNMMVSLSPFYNTFCIE